MKGTSIYFRKMKANRGMFLETIIERTIQYYSTKNIAYLSKRYLPVKIYAFNGQRIQGWLNAKTQTDYYGVFKGKYFDFEAKQTKEASLPLANIKLHQINHMKKILLFGAIVFFIIYFQNYEKFYLLKFQDFLTFISNNSERKSIPYSYFEEKGIQLELIYPGVLDLEIVFEKLIK